MILAWNHCWFTLFTWCVSQLFWMVSCDIDLWLGMGAFIVVKTWTLSEWNSKSAVFFFQIFFSLVSRDWYKTKAGGENVRQICIFWCLYLSVSFFFAVQDCPSANNGDACGVVVALRTSTGCCFGGDSMGRPWVASPSGLLIVEGLEHVEFDVLEGSQCNDICIRWHFKELR